MNSLDFPEDPVQSYNHYSLIINMQANSHWSQGEHRIDIKLSKNNTQILSAFNFTLIKTLFMIFFFLYPYNFHYLGVGKRPGEYDW